MGPVAWLIRAGCDLVVRVGRRSPQLLDLCVKNCGYPLHKQVGSKKFLNGLVRQFTERPPVRAGVRARQAVPMPSLP